MALRRSEPSPAETLTAPKALSNITEETIQCQGSAEALSSIRPEPKFKLQQGSYDDMNSQRRQKSSLIGCASQRRAAPATRSSLVPLQLEQWDDAIGPRLVLAEDRRRGDDVSPHEFALRGRQLARRRVERFRADLDMHRRICP